MFPFVQQLFRFPQQNLRGTVSLVRSSRVLVHCSDLKVRYLLLAGIAHVAVRVEEGSNVHGLAAPELSLNCPVERRLQCAAIQRPEHSRWSIGADLDQHFG